MVTEERRRVEHVRTEREEDARLMVWGSFFKRERKSRGTKDGWRGQHGKLVGARREGAAGGTYRGNHTVVDAMPRSPWRGLGEIYRMFQRRHRSD